jgi:hypothetical protein
MTDESLAQPRPCVANVVDWCHGFTGGVKIRCSCGDYWVLEASASDREINDSIDSHYRAKSQQPRERQP